VTNSGAVRHVHWRGISERGDILCVAAGRSLASVLDQARRRGAKWVVIVRASTEYATVKYYHYVFSFAELTEIAEKRKSLGAAAKLEAACELHEWRASAPSSDRLGTLRLPPSDDLPLIPEAMAATRLVDLDPFARVVAIGVSDSDVLWEAKTNADAQETGDKDWAAPGELGPLRGVATGVVGSTSGAGAEKFRGEDRFEDAAAPGIATRVGGSATEPGRAGAASLPIAVSAETESKIIVGARAMVGFRIEGTAGAEPLASFLKVKAEASGKITVALSAENDVVTIVNEATRAYEPPAPGEAREDAFVIRGARPGVCRLSVSFWQAGGELGAIGLAVEVAAERAAAPVATRGTGRLNTSQASDRDKLTVLVEQRSEGGETRYFYKLHGESLSLDFVSRKSKPLRDRGGGFAASTLKYFEHVYSRLTQRLDASSLGVFEREVGALGVELCNELFDPEVVEILWDLRERISAVRVVSWEPYVPWELLRLRNPRTGETDQKFLAEYGLVRGLEGETPPRTLACRSLRYLVAEYPCRTLTAIGAKERAFLSGEGPETMRALGFEVSAAPPTLDGLSEAIRSGVDCLHICCHAETDHQSVETAKLILGDYQFGGKAHQIEAFPFLVGSEAGRSLSLNRPIVFLNACESGRAGPSLTSEGGWPAVFLRAGAGVFVGTSWSVRDEPATRFARSFYESLRGGKTLAEAVTAARQAARALPDASWLAFKVYGDPFARRPKETS
jgi:hypothetical protein